METEIEGTKEEEEEVGGSGAETDDETEEDEGGSSETETETDSTCTETETETERCMVFPLPIVWNPSSEEKDRIADSNHLQKFALDELQSIPLADLVLDAIFFEKLYRSKKFWFCHFCGSYFSDGDSLTMHLKIEHIPSIAEYQTLLSLHKQDQEFVQGSICKMVWKPINVEHALRHFYKLCLDARLAEVKVEELPWPWSDDDPERSKLVSQLEQVLKDLASNENGLSFLCSGPLRQLIAVASRHILVRLPCRDHVLDFTRQLASSPLSFCFLEKESLIQFVQVARHMSQIVKNFSALDKYNSISCNMRDDSSINYRLCFLLNGKVYIVLGPENWQDQKQFDIPCTGPLHPPSEPPEFLAQLALCSDFCCKLVTDETISCSYTLYDHISTRWSYQALLQSHKVPFKTQRSDLENGQVLDWSCPVTNLEKKRKDFLIQADVLGLQVVEDLCAMQSLEFEVRRLCTFDFRSYIVPLMQRFLQRCSGVSSKEEKYHPNTSLPISGCGDEEADNSGIFICVYLSALVHDIDDYLEMIDEVRKAIYFSRIHKTWRYWYCYYCCKKFLNSESHMKHMDDRHNLNLPCDEQSRLVPRSPSKHEVDQLLGFKRKPLSYYLPNTSYGDHMKKYAILERMKELLYSVLEDKTVPFSGSHLVHLSEFARDEFFRIMSSDEKKLEVAKKIDETTQLDFSMHDTCCLQSVENFLENLCKQCPPIEMQTHESTNIPDVASCGIFCAGPNLIFDAAKFAEVYSHGKKAVKEKHPFISNYKSFKEIEKGLRIELDTLKGHFDEKHKVLGELDVVFALDRMLIRKRAHAETLGSWYKNQLISQLLSEGSFLSFEEAVIQKKDKLLYRLADLDIQIMQELARINKLKREMSDLCFWDYSTDILLVIGAFLKPRIRVDGDLTPWASNKLQELLRSIDRPAKCFKNFRITSVSIGQIFVNIRDKWGLGFDYKKMRLNFEGEWQSVLWRDRYDGYVDFVGSSDWYDRKNEDMKAEATVVFTSGKILVDELVLGPLFRKAICAKLLKFQEAFVVKNDVCIIGHDPLSDCLRDVGWEYCCLDERHRQKNCFNNIEWDSSSSDEDTGGTPRTAMYSAVDHAGKVIGDGEDLLGT